ncbi:hypothetical protein CXU21_09835 [Akkermansia muciniphila]|nr:hypothetical protein CXU21_09835 [Akkermansia muciniphila]
MRRDKWPRHHAGNDPATHAAAIKFHQNTRLDIFLLYPFFDFFLSEEPGIKIAVQVKIKLQPTKLLNILLRKKTIFVFLFMQYHYNSLSPSFSTYP